MIKIRVRINPKPGILDPEGKAINLGLHNLGYNQVDNVVTGKIIDLKINHNDLEKAKDEAKDMCDRLLANPHMENYEIEIQEDV
ncbi:MAG: phosphoribosylformylglycinamidine synthase subunit PurS [Candidatus Muiribacteriota bacterium]